MVPTSTPVSFPAHSLADIVTADPRTAAVFDQAGLDYCCHGHDSLEDAARARGVPLGRVLTDLAALGPADSPAQADAHTMPLDALTADIVNRHHRYVRESTPLIAGWLAKLVARHGERHPELTDIQETFGALGQEMAMHMVKEENILFPFVDALAASFRERRGLPASPFGTILNPIRLMEEDHRGAGDELARLRLLTNNYTPPPDGCTTYRLCYAELAKYEADLHRHVHLENNVLFPRAVELERHLA